MRISDWSSDVCSSDLLDLGGAGDPREDAAGGEAHAVAQAVADVPVVDPRHAVVEAALHLVQAGVQGAAEGRVQLLEAAADEEAGQALFQRRVEDRKSVV